jgi:transposase
VEVLGADGGPPRRAQIFVAVLGASSYTYAEATWTQSLPDWIGSHQRAFAFFGGVPELLIPDNLRAGVTKADRYAPEPNATYLELARHYGTAILPARPYKPKDKAKAEVGVQVVERWILARLRHRTFRSLAELNAAIGALLVELNERPFQKLPGSRRSLFERLDRAALKALPEAPYELAEWRRCRAGLDYHVQVAGSAYSVPHALAGQLLDVRLSGTGIEVFNRGKRVAVHPRGKAGQTCTVAEHMPKAHREHHQWSPQHALDWAAEIGPAALVLVERQLQRQSHPEHAYRAWLGLRNAERSYGSARLEAACERALAIDSPTYRSVASILKQGLDHQPPPAAEDGDAEPPAHANLRGSRYYH